MKKNKNTLLGGTEARWKRFSNEHFSAFKSMHKSISIGVLSIATITSADLKAQTQPDSSSAEFNYQLQDIEVTSERVPLTMSVAPRMVTVMTKEDVSAATVQSINDLLEYAVVWMYVNVERWVCSRTSQLEVVHSTRSLSF